MIFQLSSKFVMRYATFLFLVAKTSAMGIFGIRSIVVDGKTNRNDCSG